MYCMTEKEIEAELEIEVRDLHNSDGQMGPVRGCRFMWRNVDTGVTSTDIDPFDILEVARMYEHDYGSPFEDSLSLTIEYFRQKDLLGRE